MGDIMAADLNIATSADNPAAAMVDGQSVTAQPLLSKIAGEQYLAAKGARGRPFGGGILSKIRPAGCPADQQGTGNFQYLGQQGF